MSQQTNTTHATHIGAAARLMAERTNLARERVPSLGGMLDMPRQEVLFCEYLLSGYSANVAAKEAGLTDEGEPGPLNPSTIVVMQRPRVAMYIRHRLSTTLRVALAPSALHAVNQVLLSERAPAMARLKAAFWVFGAIGIGPKKWDQQEPDDTFPPPPGASVERDLGGLKASLARLEQTLAEARERVIDIPASVVDL